MSSKALPASVNDEIAKALADLRANTPSTIGCVVSTVDGRLVAQQVDNEADPKRIAAMASAMVALGQTIGREVRIGRSEFVVVHAVHGLFVLQRVPAKRDLLVVGLVARASATLGIALHQIGKATTRIATAMDEWLERQRLENPAV